MKRRVRTRLAGGLALSAAMTLAATLPALAVAPHRDPGPRASYVPDVLVVKFSRPAASSKAFKPSVDTRGFAVIGVSSIDALNRQYGARLVTREGLARPRNLEAARRLGLDRTYLIYFTGSPDIQRLAAEYAADPAIESAHPDWLAYPAAVVPDDTRYPSQWGHRNRAQMPSWRLASGQHDGANVGTIGFDAGMETAWDVTPGFGDASTIIAIIDAGVDWGHPELSIWSNPGELPNNNNDDDSNGFIDDVRGWDFGMNDNDPNDDGHASGRGHGTACAGVAAAIADNTQGVAGTAGGCTVMPLKVAVNAMEGFSFTAVSNAIIYAADNGASVISMSLSGPADDNVRDACIYADILDVVILAATGNENASAIAHPAAYPQVIAVGAAANCGERKRSSSNAAEVNPGVNTDPNGVTCDGEVWWGSNYGLNTKDDPAAVDVVAPTILPTTDIRGANGYDPGDYSGFFNGTSCATPYAAGICALIRSNDGNLRSDQVRAHLVDWARDIVGVESVPGWDRYTGYGLVQGCSALNNGGTPKADTAVIKTRIFDDCPSSVVTTSNAYPASIAIGDSALGCFGFANLHNWSFSTDGETSLEFHNNWTFSFSADLVISGATESEAGLRISPWWSPDVDGRFNVRTTDGEIACFGGRLPFYSFTMSQSVTYTKGDPIHLEMMYQPNGLSAASPATIEYKLTYNSTNYASGPLAFDEGNPAEDPPHGLWGIGQPAYAGGYVQCFLVGGNNSAQVSAVWSNIQFDALPNPAPVPGLGPWSLAALATLLAAAGLTSILWQRSDACPAA